MTSNGSQAQRIGVVVAMVALLGSACAGDSGRSEVPAPSGRTLDCPDELIASAAPDLLEDAIGYNDPQQAMNAYMVFDQLKGTPYVEEETTGSVTFVFSDEDENRLARIGVSLTDRGWFVTRSEKCGSET